MRVKRVVAGIYGANCYIIMDETNNKSVVLDPGGDVDDITKAIEEMGAEVECILLTHGHLDHTTGVKELKDLTNARVGINKIDEDMIKKAANLYGPLLPGNADFYVEHGDEVEVGNLKIKCIATPGHTPGGMCYLLEDSIFTGDTLFYGSIGRTDLEGGDYEKIISSIKNNILTLHDETVVYPGHGPASSVGNEKSKNRFLK